MLILASWKSPTYFICKVYKYVKNQSYLSDITTGEKPD
jgi:hypothetical protein